MNEKLEQLLKQKSEIEDQIKLIEHEKLNEKWEPVGGNFCIITNNTEYYPLSTRAVLFGMNRTTTEQAEKARDKMRVFNRLLAYHDEFCADYEFLTGEYNYFVFFYGDKDSKYHLGYNDLHNALGVVYFPEHIAKELVEKLNSGVVEL